MAGRTRVNAAPGGYGWEALATLGALLHDAYHDPDKLRELLRTADPEWFD
jgi:hypothetical protein